MATFRGISSNEVLKITECVICTESFKEPKILPCIHTFCLHCLERYGTEKEKDPGNKVDCPLCRNQFTVPHGGFKDLPNNNFIIQLMQLGQSPRSGLEELLHVVCDLCYEVDEKSEAIVYCIECEKHLCKPCCTKHAQLKTKNHQVMALKDKPSAEELNKMAPSYCDKHPNKDIEFYCYDCQMIACVVCYVDHKLSQHKCSDLEKSAEEFRSQFKNDIERVTPYIARNQNKMKQLEDSKKSFSNKVETAKAELTQKYNQIQSLLEEHQKQLISKLDSFQDETLKELETNKEETERQVVILESYNRYCKEMHNKGSLCEIARAANNLHITADKIVKAQEELVDTQLSSADINFIPSSATTGNFSNVIGDFTFKKTLDKSIPRTCVTNDSECEKDVCSELKGSVIDVADDHSSETISMDFGYFDLIRRYQAEELLKINLQLSSAGGGLNYNKEGEGDCEFKLTGRKSDLNKAINDLRKLADRIQAGDHEIDFMSTYFEQRQGKVALTGLEKTYNVSIQIANCTAQVRSGLSTGHTLISKVTIGNEQNILLIDGDITTYKVDAIVNAANKDLHHGGGIAKAISNAAGPEIDLECKNYICDNQPLLPGQVYVSKPGNLSCKCIIHAVGPVWRGGNRKEPEQLRLAVCTSLLEASNREVRTIALPAISTGIFNFPLNLATEIILSSVEEFMHKNGSSSLKEVHIIDVDKKVLSSFELELNRMGDKYAKTERQDQGLQCQLHHHNVEQPEGDYIATAVRNSELSQRRILQICAFSEESIMKVIKEIHLVLDCATLMTVLESDEDAALIRILTESQLARIYDLERSSPNIRIQVERMLHLNRIRVRGEGKAVTENVQEIYKILHETDKDEHRGNEVEFDNKMVHWEHVENGEYVPYPERINVIIERALANKKDCAEWIEGHDQHYRLMFHAKQEICIKTAVLTAVRRTTIVPLPAHWYPMSDTENLKVVEILPNFQEYSDVEKRAKATAKGAIKTIVKIERIQNRRLYKQYMVTKEDKEKTKPRSMDYEKTLWHGTDAETVDKIDDSIFNRNYALAGKKATQGIYFAVNFADSAQNTYAKPDDHQVKRVYQCKVFVGEFTKGNPNMKEPPPKSPSSNENYDSVVDNPSAPKMFVIFYEAQAYPEYLIYFK